MKLGKHEKRERNKTLVTDDRWRRKGHPHGVSRSAPNVCPECKGLGRNNQGIECFFCFGEGEIYER